MLQRITGMVRSLVTAIALVIMLPVATQTKKCRYGKDDISFGKFYKAATKTNKRFLKDIFLIIFYRTHVTLVERWPSSIKDYCFDILGWSEVKYQKSFSAGEKQVLTVPLESFEGDVTLLFKLIGKLFDNINLPESFFTALRDVKDVRNRVCHDQSDFTDDMLQTNMEDLKQIFGKLLLEVNIMFGIDISGFEQKYSDEVDEIMSAAIIKEDTGYLEKMEMFREDLIGKFITYGRAELFSLYSKLKILNPLTWLSDNKFSELLVDKIFTPLHISDEDKVIDIEHLLTTKPIDENTLERTGILPSILILTGIAGCGKTSLCRYLLCDWQSRLGTVAKLRSVDLLILIEPRSLTTNSFVSYLQRTLLKDTCSYFEESDILPTLQKLNILYVVDGFDEATDDGRQLLNELFSNLGTSRVILTTRPEFTSSIVSSALDHHLTFMELDIHGFSDKGVAIYMSKVFHSLESNETNRNVQEVECLRFCLTTGRSLGDQIKIPLTLALLIILWRNHKSSFTKITSVTRLYSEIFKMCTMKMLTRISRNTSSTFLDLETFVEEWQLELGRMAYNMVRKYKHVISDDQRNILTSVCNKYSVDSIQALSAFLICEVQEGPDGIRYLFSFMHKSQMEYLAGYYHAHLMISDLNKEKNVSVSSNFKDLQLFDDPSEGSRKEIIQMREMKNVFMFTIGHLCMEQDVRNELVAKVAEKLLKNITMATKISEIWRLVQESDCNPVVCNIVREVVSGNYIWKPEGEELCDPLDPTLQLLKYTQLSLKGLMIRMVDGIQHTKILGDKDEVEKRPYENVIPILQSMAKYPETKVVLRVDAHYYNWGDQETTDPLLLALIPNGNLTAFMGHLGISGSQYLAAFCEIQWINVRISDAEALHCLCDSVAAMSTSSYLKMTVRLDISQTLSPLSLPTFREHPPFNIVLRNIGDETVQWTSEVLAQLSTFYNQLELVSSNLTPDGGKILFKSLLEKRVEVKEKIYIRTPHSLDKETQQDINKLIECKLEWL